MAGERGTEELRAIVPPCCTVGALGVESLPEAEQQVVDRTLPGSKSLVVLAHQVTAVTEWVWFPLGREKTRMTCAADLHCQVVLGRLRERIARLGEESELVPYPALSGLSFKLVAAAAGLGEMTRKAPARSADAASRRVQGRPSARPASIGPHVLRTKGPTSGRRCVLPESARSV